jgi:hypothetical protein
MIFTCFEDIRVWACPGFGQQAKIKRKYKKLSDLFPHSLHWAGRIGGGCIWGCAKRFFTALRAELYFERHVIFAI